MIEAVAACDPGSNGSFGVLTVNRQLFTWKFSKDSPLEVIHAVTLLKSEHGIKIIKGYKEQVGAMPKDKKRMARFATFMRNDANAKMIFKYHGIDTQEIPPRIWQLFSGVGYFEHVPGNTEDQDKTARKNMYKDKAQETFPDIKVTLATSDMLLLLEFGWQKQFGV